MNSDYIPGIVVAAPVATANPVLSPTVGVARGTMLSVTDGSWTGTPTSFRYQWRRDSSDIVGATTNTYTVVLADNNSAITCRVWASNATGESATFAGSNSTSTISFVVLDVPIIPTPTAAANGTSVTSAAYNPPATCLILVAVGARVNAAINQPNLINNGGLTATPLVDLFVTPDPGSGVRFRHRIWAVPVGASPPTGLTFSCTTAQASTRYTLSQVLVQGTMTVPATSDVSGMYASANPFPAFDHTPAVDSTIISIFAGTVAAATPCATPSADFIELEDVWPTAGQIQCQICYDPENGAVNTIWSAGAYTVCAGTAIEVRQP